MRAALALVLAVGCGRVDFGSAASNTIDAIDDAHAMTGSGDAAPAAIAYVGPIAMSWLTMGSSITFNVQAANAGDAVVVLFACAGSQMPSTGTLTGGAWTFASLTAVYGSSGNQLWGQTFGAIAPDTQPVTITASWTAANCNRGLSVLGDELTGVDPGGGTLTFDGHAETFGAVGPVTGSLVTAHAGDAVWAAAYSGMALTAVGSGYTKGADDGNGDWSEYKLTSDPAGATEAVTFSSPAQPWLLGVATLNAR